MSKKRDSIDISKIVEVTGVKPLRIEYENPDGTLFIIICRVDGIERPFAYDIDKKCIIDHFDDSDVYEAALQSMLPVIDRILVEKLYGPPS